MTKIKICGLAQICDIDAVNAALPDFIGFVFAESRRRVTINQAAAMKQRLDQRIKAVGVFVNADADEISRLAAAGIIDMVQLHGDEDGDYIARLKRLLEIPVIKAVRVQSRDQLLAAQELPCDYLLLDTYQKGVYGGTGRTFDYSLVPPLVKPFFLAGGLNAQNIGEALAAGPFAVDISGGVETDGIKDAEKIREIVGIVRNM